MSIGSEFVFMCPKCRNLIRRGRYSKESTFGHASFTDGYAIQFFVTEGPEVAKCMKCGWYFRMTEENLIGSFRYWNENIPFEWVVSDVSYELTTTEIYEALELGTPQNREEEFLLRLDLWRTYNHRARRGNDMFWDENDEKKWVSSMHTLLTFLDDDDNVEYQKIKAEIYRNLGEFDKCLEIINQTKVSEDKSFRRILKRECKKKNRWVVLMI